MKVLVVGFGKISYMPYMNIYTEIMINISKQIDLKVDLVYWERDSKKDSIVPNLYEDVYKFISHVEESNGFVKKIPSFIRYKLYAQKIIKNNKYDKLIILHSTPGLVLLNTLKKYKNKYILDYRDFSHENIYIYRKFVSKLVKLSKLTFISSDGYRNYLPKSKKIFTTHNLLTDTLQFREVSKGFRNNRLPIIIRYWGLIRHRDINLEIIKKLANDKRFELHYHGREQKDAKIMLDYCKKNDVNNVYFHGEYLPSDRNSFARHTHIIHNIYENTKGTIKAMGNKYYDGIIYRIPQICNSKSFMGDKVKSLGLGISLNPTENDFANKIYQYFMAIDYEDFDNNCDCELNTVYEEYNSNIEIIEKFIKE